MTTWIVEPRDSVVLRNGRPTGEGDMMRSLLFPWPSTIAGLVRYRVGTDVVTGRFGLSADDARRIRVAGPWLARLDEKGDVEEWFVRAPRDCLWERAPAATTLLRTRLGLVTEHDGESHDASATGLSLVGPLARTSRSKPEHGPAFWSWQELVTWLAAPVARSAIGPQFGLPALVPELRLHVSVDPLSQTAADGMLFGAEGLRFTHGKGSNTRRLAVVLRCDDARLATRAGAAMLGGERRLSSFRRASKDLDLTPPAGVGTQGNRLRVVLLTPAIFAAGAVPATIAGAKVIAAAVDRPEVISGWDMQRELVRDEKGERLVERGEKATRRMAPAGSVYWVEVEGDARKWAEDTWLTCVSDHEQDRLDGFGLCVVGGA